MNVSAELKSGYFLYLDSTIYDSQGNQIGEYPYAQANAINGNFLQSGYADARTTGEKARSTLSFFMADTESVVTVKTRIFKMTDWSDHEIVNRVSLR